MSNRIQLEVGAVIAWFPTAKTPHIRILARVRAAEHILPAGLLPRSMLSLVGSMLGGGFCWARSWWMRARARVLSKCMQCMSQGTAACIRDRAVATTVNNPRVPIIIVGWTNATASNARCSRLSGECIRWTLSNACVWAASMVTLDRGSTVLVIVCVYKWIHPLILDIVPFLQVDSDNLLHPIICLSDHHFLPFQGNSNDHCSFHFGMFASQLWVECPIKRTRCPWTDVYFHIFMTLILERACSALLALSNGFAR